MPSRPASRRLSIFGLKTAAESDDAAVAPEKPPISRLFRSKSIRPASLSPAPARESAAAQHGSTLPLAPAAQIASPHPQRAPLHRSAHSVLTILPSSHRPASSEAALPGSEPANSADKASKRRSWFSHVRRSSKFVESQLPELQAWVAGHTEKQPYDLNTLTSAWRVPELWLEDGDTLIYLFPPNSGKGPSFRLDSSLFASSAFLTKLASGQNSTTSPNRQSAEESFAGPLVQLRPAAQEYAASSGLAPTEAVKTTALFLPLSLSRDAAILGRPLTPLDVETLATVRNLFAFLLGQSLVCTDAQPTLLAVFLSIADLLKAYEFSNADGSTFGEVAAESFNAYVEELGLGDVRTSREKTIEALILGERMRSVLLYNEAFTHAAGKYHSIQTLTSKNHQALAKATLFSSTTQNRLQRAAIKLDNRKTTVNIKLTDFEFPGLFAGVFSRKSTEERKLLNVDGWKTAFMATRRQLLTFYKTKYGTWPPRADSRSPLETAGFNRTVLKGLYSDFTDLYDLWVDRTSLTTRPVADDSSEEVKDRDPAKRLQRKLFDEYDQSTPPVQPPIPYDTVALPSLEMTRSDYGKGDYKKDSKARSKKLGEEEMIKLLDASCNEDILRSDVMQKPLVVAMREWERRQAKSCNISQIRDLRCGMWILIYVVMQSLPMLVIDAPAVRHCEGVEYFLCEPPRGGVPWATNSSAGGKNNYYRVAGGGGVVSLPSDVVEHGVEGVYERSHCWRRAAEWDSSNNEDSFDNAPEVAYLSPDEDEHASMETAPYEWHIPFESTSIWSPTSPNTSRGFTPSVSSQATADGSGRSSPGSWGSRPSTGQSSWARSRDASTGTHSWTTVRSREVSTGHGSWSSARPRDSIAQRNVKRDSLWNLGLEALPLPSGVQPDARGMISPTRAASTGASGMTFDDIIANMDSNARSQEDKKKTEQGKK